jgi:hypothetical protein
VSGARVTIIFEPTNTAEIVTSVYGTTHGETRRTLIQSRREDETIVQALAERLPTTETTRVEGTD